MTVNASSTLEFNINQVVKLALQSAGLLPAGAQASGVQWETKATQARELLDVLVDALQLRGQFARSTEFYDVTIVEGTSEYALPATTVAVIGEAMMATEDEDFQTTVRPVSMGEYQAISEKTSTGRPTLFWAQMHATVSLVLWPVPDSDGTLTIQRQRLLADNNDGSATLDLERYWTRHIMYMLAHDLAVANSMPIQRCGYLRSLAESELALCKAKASGRVQPMITSAHRTQWSK